MKKIAFAAAISLAVAATPALAGQARQARPVAQCVVPSQADLDGQFAAFTPPGQRRTQTK